MLSVRIPSYETYRIGTRPAVLASLNRMLDYFNVNVEQRIFFNGEAEVSKLLGGEGKDKRGSDLGVDLGYDNKLFVELERTESGYNDELDAYSGNNSNPPLWYDPITKSSIFPKFITRKYNVVVNAFFKDRVTAERYLTNIRRGVLSPHQNVLFNVDTHFPTTYPQLNCFQEIMKRLQAAGVVAQDKNFIDWMEENSTVPVGILRNAAFNAPVFVFKQQMADIGVIMENPNLALVTSGSYIGKFEVSFRYSFYWSEMTEWIMNYPIQVYQQPMPSEYIPDVFGNNKEEYASRMFFEAAASKKVWDYRKNQAPFYQVFPSQDNWRPNSEYWVSPQLQALVNVENVEQQVLLNMKNIPNFTWNQTVIDYIIKYRDKVLTRHDSPLYIAVWSDDGTSSEQVLSSQLSLNENGDLTLNRLPKMSNCYRVVFSFDYSLRTYSEDCILDLLNDPDFAKWIIGILFPAYPWPGNWGDNGMLDWEDTHNSIDVGDGPELGFYMPYGTMYSLIVAKNSSSYQQYVKLKDAGKLYGPDYNRWDQSTS